MAKFINRTLFGDANPVIDFKDLGYRIYTVTRPHGDCEEHTFVIIDVSVPDDQDWHYVMRCPTLNEAANIAIHLVTC